MSCFTVAQRPSDDGRQGQRGEKRLSTTCGLRIDRWCYRVQSPFKTNPPVALHVRKDTLLSSVLFILYSPSLKATTKTVKPKFSYTELWWHSGVKPGRCWLSLRESRGCGERNVQRKIFIPVCEITARGESAPMRSLIKYVDIQTQSIELRLVEWDGRDTSIISI